MYVCVVAYDIADEKRLRRMARLCEEHGTRLQRSVFETGMTHAGLGALRLSVRRRIDCAQDKVLFQPLCSRCRLGVLFQGKPPPAAGEPFWIV